MPRLKTLQCFHHIIQRGIKVLPIGYKTLHIGPAYGMVVKVSGSYAAHSVVQVSDLLA